jgi:hypothetical protein
MNDIVFIACLFNCGRCVGFVSIGIQCWEGNWKHTMFIKNYYNPNMFSLCNIIFSNSNKIKSSFVFWQALYLWIHFLKLVVTQGTKEIKDDKGVRVMCLLLLMTMLLCILSFLYPIFWKELPSWTNVNLIIILKMSWTCPKHNWNSNHAYCLL